MFEYDNYLTSTTSITDILNNNNVKLLKDLVVIEPIDDMKEGMFFIAGKHEDNDVHTTFCKGKVMAVGEGYRTNWGALVNPDVKVGDTVLLDRAYMMREKTKDGFIYLTKERDIIAILDLKCTI